MNGAWSTAKIAGKPADVYDPPGEGRPRFGVLHLHGVGLKTLRDRPAFTRLFDELRIACVCPHGQRCWWADRICPEFDPELSPEQPSAPKRAAVLPGALGPRAAGRGAARRRHGRAGGAAAGVQTPRPVPRRRGDRPVHRIPRAVRPRHAHRCHVRQQGAVPPGHGADARPPQPLSAAPLLLQRPRRPVVSRRRSAARKAGRPRRDARMRSGNAGRRTLLAILQSHGGTRRSLRVSPAWSSRAAACYER